MKDILLLFALVAACVLLYFNDKHQKELTASQSEVVDLQNQTVGLQQQVAALNARIEKLTGVKPQAPQVAKSWIQQRIEAGKSGLDLPKLH